MTQKKQSSVNFNNLGIPNTILSILNNQGFNTPTPIQEKIIASAIAGKDIVGIAHTGTGKTLAFGIPMLSYLMNNDGQGLILVPTRELALQVEKALAQIGSKLGLRCVSVIGGIPQSKQVKALRTNPHIVIATPGRLDDLIQQRLYSLNKVKIITLDEADRMLNVGFLPQIRKILQTTSKREQTMLFSATMPQSIATIAKNFMKNPFKVEIAPQGTSAKNIEQETYIVDKPNKIRLLDALLKKYDKDTTLIFSRTKYGAKRIARDIRNMGHTATEIHSNRSQSQRKLALDGFTKNKFRIMVATDIAARGIDVQSISIVINFDLPDNSEDYVHRIGRTGRAGRHGKAISFVMPSEKSDIKKIEKLIRKKLPIIAYHELPPSRKRPPEERSNFFGKNQNNRKRSLSHSSRKKTHQHKSSFR